MSALGHQFRAELRAFRGYFLVWFVLLALHLVCVQTGEYWANHPLRQHPLLVFFRMTGFWLFLAALFLSKAAAFKDPPLDPDAFWRTKPISGRTLMTAKILALGIVFVLPVLFIEAWAVVRAGAGWAWPAVAVDHLLVRWPALVALLTLAALAGSPMRLVGVALGLLVALGAVTGVLSNITGPAQFDFTPTLIASRFLVAGVCGWVGSIGVLYLLYHSRQPGCALALAGFTACLIGITFLVWPMEFYRYNLGAEDETRLESLVLDGTIVSLASASSGARRLELQAALTYPGATLLPRLSKARVQPASPTGPAGWGRIRPDFERGGGALETDEQSALLGLPNPQPEARYSISLLLPGGPWEENPAPISLATGIDVFEQVPVGELVLEAGQILRLPHGEMEIMGLAWAPNELLIDVREKVVQPVFALRGPVAIQPPSGPGALWTLVLPSASETPPQFTRSHQGAYVLPGQNEQSLFSPFRYRRHQLRILRLDHEPNSVELIQSYQGRTVQVYQRMYRGTIRRTAALGAATALKEKDES